MVQEIFDISKKSSKFLDVIKAEQGLENQSEALEWVLLEHIADNSELNPRFVKRIVRVKGRKNMGVKNFARRYCLG